MKNQQMLVCPSQSSPTTLSSPFGAASYRVSYGYNWSWLGSGNSTPAWSRKLGDVVSAANCLMYADARRSYVVHPYSTSGTPNNYYMPDDRHNEGSNVVFVDGHAKWYRLNTIWQEGVTSGPHVDYYNYAN